MIDAQNLYSNVSSYDESVNKKQLLVPAGFAHGYCVLSENTKVMYNSSIYDNGRTPNRPK